MLLKKNVKVFKRYYMLSKIIFKWNIRNVVGRINAIMDAWD